MEAVRDFIAVEDSGRGIAPAGALRCGRCSGCGHRPGAAPGGGVDGGRGRRLVGLPGGRGFRRHGGGALAGPGLPAARGGRCRGPDQETGHHRRPNANTSWTTGWRDDSAYGTPRPDNAPALWARGRHPGRKLPRVPRVGRCPAASGSELPRVPCFPGGRGRRVPEHHGVPAGAAADQRRRGPPPARPRRGSPAAAGILREPLPPVTGNSVPPSPPARSRPGPRPSSPWPWTGSGTPATPKPPPGWNTP